MYVEVYNEDGSSKGFEFYEVGPTNGNNEGFFTHEPLDPSMAMVPGALVSGSSVSSGSGLSSGLISGSSVSGSGGAGISASNIEAGVKVDFVTAAQLDSRLSRYDRVVEFNTTKDQDQKIRSAAISNAENFGRYNVFTNNCAEYAAKTLRAGGINTSGILVPNWSHDYIIRNNSAPFMKIIR